jgi:paraquat-inducible protein B
MGSGDFTVTEEVTEEEGAGNGKPATPALKKSTRGRISMIWMIPVLAVLLGIGLIVQTSLEQGPTIEIVFADATGLKAGATPIKYLSVEVGLVTEVRLGDDQKGVVAVVELDPIADAFLDENTVFWLVRPRVSLAGVSAIETLLSGAYIEVVPGESGTRTNEFVGQLNPPIGARYPNAKTVILETQELGSITQGTTIYHRNLRAGEVEHYELSEDNGPIRIYAVIDQDFASRIRESTLFWNASGIEAHVGLDGIDVRTEGIAAVLGGGIAFSFEEGSSPEAASDSTFILYRGADAAKHAQMRRQSLELRLETRDARSLQEDSPIYYPGLQIGQVGQSWLTADAKAVRFEAFIEPQFQNLVRAGSRFYKVTGIDVSLGLDGLRLEAQTIASIAAGGVSLVTPDPPGQTVSSGTLFPLFEDAKEEWLGWRPEIDLPNERRGELVEHRLPPEPDAGALVLRLHADEIGSVTGNSAITYRNLTVGRVIDYALSQDGESVDFRIRIDRPYRHLVGPATRFWKSSGFSLDVGLDGLEVELGSLRTIALGGIEFDNPPNPGNPRPDNPDDEATGASQRAGIRSKQNDRFQLFANAAIAWSDVRESRYVTFFVEASESRLSPGAPVYFRKHRIGEVGASLLTGDARAVRSELRIERVYRTLVRANSRFWSPGAVNVSGGLKGIDLEVAPLKALLAGGVMLATPTDVQAEASAGNVFRLEGSAPENWSTWSPQITLASDAPIAVTHSAMASNGFHVVLVTSQVDSLGEGDPIFFRGMQIGKLGVPRLGEDASEVFVDAKIEDRYAYLVRANTQFWNISGFSIDLGWGGLDVDTGPLTTLIRGGVQIATPEPPEGYAEPGSRFDLRAAPDLEWQAWSPALD